MRKQDRVGLVLRLCGVLCAVLPAASGIQAAQLVTFSRGQSMVVQSAEKRGNWYYLILEGGGEIGVPVSRVASIEEYEPAPGSAVAAAAQPNRGIGMPSPAQRSGGRAAAAANPGQSAGPGGAPPPTQPGVASQANAASQGNEDWRSKVRMSGGPKREGRSLPGPGRDARGGMTGKIVPPGAQRRQQGQQPQNTPLD